MNKLDLGSIAPAFRLPDQTGKIHQLSDYHGKWLLLYFYPKDNTIGCTQEACALRDNWADFAQSDAVVLGVSADSVSSHTKFADKFKLPFPILADESRTTIEAYGVWVEKKLWGRTFMGISRMSFLIDPFGKIAKIYEKIRPANHATEVLADLRALIA